MCVCVCVCVKPQSLTLSEADLPSRAGGRCPSLCWLSNKWDNSRTLMEVVLILTLEGSKCEMRVFESMRQSRKWALMWVIRLRKLFLFTNMASAMTVESVVFSVSCIFLIICITCSVAGQFDWNQFQNINNILFWYIYLYCIYHDSD